MFEKWEDIKGFEGYMVSSLGRIYSKKRLRILKQREKRGYYYVFLYNTHGRKQCAVHRLVAGAFIPNPNSYPEINHKDENPSNNTISNLEWCTSAYNSHYGHHIERLREFQGSDRNVWRGRKHSIESKERMSQAKIGKPSKRKLKVIVGDKEYSSLTECSKSIGVSLSQLHNILTGKRKNNTNLKIEKYV